MGVIARRSYRYISAMVVISFLIYIISLLSRTKETNDDSLKGFLISDCTGTCGKGYGEKDFIAIGQKNPMDDDVIVLEAAQIEQPIVAMGGFPELDGQDMPENIQFHPLIDVAPKDLVDLFQDGEKKQDVVNFKEPEDIDVFDYDHNTTPLYIVIYDDSKPFEIDLAKLEKMRYNKVPDDDYALNV